MTREPGRVRSAALAGAGSLRVAGGVQVFALGSVIASEGLVDLGVGAATANPVLIGGGVVITGLGVGTVTVGAAEIASGLELLVEGLGGGP